MIWKSRNFKKSKNSKIHENHGFWRFCEKWQNHSQIAYINFFVDQKSRFFVFFVFFHEKKTIFGQNGTFQCANNSANKWLVTPKNDPKLIKMDQKWSKNVKNHENRSKIVFFMVFHENGHVSYLTNVIESALFSA